MRPSTRSSACSGNGGAADARALPLPRADHHDVLRRPSAAHFHVSYGRHNAQVLLDGTILAGALPRRQHRLVQRWAKLHQAELEESWDRAARRQTLGTIEPLP